MKPINDWPDVSAGGIPRDQAQRAIVAAHARASEVKRSGGSVRLEPNDRPRKRSMRMTIARVARRYMLLTGCSVHQTARDLTMIRRRVVDPESLSRSIATLAAEQPQQGITK